MQLWLAKTPAERLIWAVRDNEALFVFRKHFMAQLSIATLVKAVED
jgi:hypothetical protein